MFTGTEFRIQFLSLKAHLSQKLWEWCPGQPTDLPAMCSILRLQSTFRSFEAIHIPRDGNEDRSCPSLQAEHSHLFSKLYQPLHFCGAHYVVSVTCPLWRRGLPARENISFMPVEPPDMGSDVTVLLMHFLTPVQKVLKYFITIDVGECRSLSSCPLVCWWNLLKPYRQMNQISSSLPALAFPIFIHSFSNTDFHSLVDSNNVFNFLCWCSMKDL